MTGLFSGALLMGGAAMGGMPQSYPPQLSQPYGGGQYPPYAQSYGGAQQNPAIIMQAMSGQGLPGQGAPHMLPPMAQMQQGGMTFAPCGGSPFGPGPMMQHGPLPYPQGIQGAPGQGLPGQGFDSPRGPIVRPHDPRGTDDSWRDERPQERHEWLGTVQSVSATSSNFTIKGGRRSFMVQVGPTTAIKDRNGTVLTSISSFQSGDVVKVTGTSSAPTIAPSSVVNTSLPR